MITLTAATSLFCGCRNDITIGARRDAGVDAVDGSTDASNEDATIHDGQVQDVSNDG